MGKALEKRLCAVWNHGTPIGETPTHGGWRYIPRSLNGGPGWGVWDRKTERFLSDAQVCRLPMSALRDERFAN